MSQTVCFIPAKENDAMTIIELRRQVWAATYRGIYPDSMIDDFDYAWHKKKELQRIKHPSYNVYLITKDTHRIGYLTTHKTDVITLQSLYIITEYQHQGIGKQAFDFVIEYCKRNNVHSFICHCVPENHNARLFYERMGGKIVAEDLGNDESWMNSVVYQFDF